jgi:hypothetical protein
MHCQPGGLRAARTGCLHLHQPAAAQPKAPAITGTAAERSRCQRPNGSQAPLQSWPGDLCPAKDGSGAGVWPDQGIQTAGSVPIAGPGAGERGMGADGHHPQPAQTVLGIAAKGLREQPSVQRGLGAKTLVEATTAASCIGRVQLAARS